MYTYESIHEPKQFTYDVAQRVTEHLIEYYFISKGERDLLKMVQYSFVEDVNERKLYNFGFGDYNFWNGRIADHVISNNGDTYKVFNTVLSTVPGFFEIQNNAILQVKGSDSSPGFAEACRVSCRKNCADFCSNAGRRINIYRGYVNKHYDILRKDYAIYGELVRTENKIIMIDYTPDQQQESIFLTRNKNQYNMKAEENQTQEVMEPTSEEEMWALFFKQREAANWSDLFARQNAEAKAYIRGILYPDELEPGSK
ncbi:DUF6934 family protein [Chitinophaga niabensis]|uniref:Uncharacterized protein n=1 Tax=Chitinophaga niabensis TaxID=536979 RepID=A0A1N6GEA2_9BACT|nr:hypothetical protein [Chitinophaga niabensis]SIO05732.1 hypothetical protein SAMN04488055_2721 [Chitinophaga niabensis]